MITRLIISLVSFFTTYWICAIIDHWNDTPRMGTWYWSIWWNITSPFYSIGWWYKKHFKNKKDI